MTTTAATHLQQIAERWPLLADMLTTHHGAPWPPAGRMTDYLAALDAADREAVRTARAAQRAAERDPEQLGETAAPIRLTVLDTARAVEAGLLALADQVAAAVQRPAAREIRSAGPLDETGLRLALATTADQADPRRWRFVGTRTVPQACTWLAARLDDAPGPFERLTLEQRDRITQAAAEAAARVDTALDLTRRATALDEPCPHCRGDLELHSGDGQPPEVRCADCRRTWRESEPAA